MNATLASARLALLQGETAATKNLPVTARELMVSEDAQEGIRAMLERRPGDFKGW